MVIFTVFTFLLAFVFVPTSQGQSNVFPNEIQGFEFFGRGRLSGLQLGVSTQEDVKKIFGERCGFFCDYDADWTINFSYYENGLTREEYNLSGEKALYYLDPKYIGTLREIKIRPKNQITFAHVSFPNTFKKSLKRYHSSETRSKRGRIITHEVFQDSFGLTYELFTVAEYDEIISGKLNNKGDLHSIQYTVSREQEKRMFIMQGN